MIKRTHIISLLVAAAVFLITPIAPIIWCYTDIKQTTPIQLTTVKVILAMMFQLPILLIIPLSILMIIKMRRDTRSVIHGVVADTIVRRRKKMTQMLLLTSSVHLCLMLPRA